MKRLTKKEVARMRARMKALHWDDAALAVSAGLNPSTVWRVLNQKTSATRVTIKVMDMALSEGERREHANQGAGQESQATEEAS